MLTCNQITKAFNDKHPELKKYGAWLIQGEGYFYLTSDEDLFYRKMIGTSIYTYRLKHMTLEQWIGAIEALFEESDLL
jgi:hypothetical protein